MSFRYVLIADHEMELAEQACRRVASFYRADARSQQNPNARDTLEAGAAQLEVLADRLTRYRGRSN